jgi:hypothetical protein
VRPVTNEDVLNGLQELKHFAQGVTGMEAYVKGDYERQGRSDVAEAHRVLAEFWREKLPEVWAEIERVSELPPRGKYEVSSVEKRAE